MSNVVVYGAPQSTFVRTTRLVLEEKGVAHQLEPVEFGTESHLALHPFGRIPAFRHGDFLLYETPAIANYVDAAFDGPYLRPASPKDRALMDKWISVACDYLYDDIIRVLVFERLVYPSRGQASNEARIKEVMPRVESHIELLENALSQRDYFVGSQMTLADLFMVPILFYAWVAPDGQAIIKDCPHLMGWWGRMSERPSLDATAPPMPEAAE